MPVNPDAYVTRTYDKIVRERGSAKRRNCPEKSRGRVKAEPLRRLNLKTLGRPAAKPIRWARTSITPRSSSPWISTSWHATWTRC